MRDLRLPDDPTGISEAHDILVAEEFAFPSGPDREPGLRRGGGPGPLAILAAAALAAVVYAALRRR